MANELRQTFRSLRRSPGFSLAVIATFALGIAATTSVFAVFDAVLLQPLGYARPDRLVRVMNDSLRMQKTRAVTISWPDAVDVERQSGAFTSISYVAQWHPSLSAAGEPEILTGNAVDSRFFDTLGVRPERGRFFVPAEDEPGNDDKVVISHGLWMRKFGGGSVIGKALRVDGRSLTIVGIVPPSFEDPHAHEARDAEIWTTLAPVPAEWSRDGRSLVAIGRLRDGVTIETARARVAAVAARLRAAYAEDRDMTVVVRPMAEMMAGGVRRPLSILLAASALLLLIACFNVVNLFLARSARRSAELGVRVALGATGWQLARRVLLEAALLACAGGAAGLLAANAIVRGFARLTADTIPRMRGVAPDARVLAFTIAVTAACALLASVLPSLRAMTRRAVPSAARGSATSRSALRVQEGVVVLQIAMSLVVIVAAALLGRSVWNLTNIDKGIDERGVLTIHARASRDEFPKRADFEAFYRQATRLLGTIPGVELAATTSILPYDGDWSCDGFSIDVDATRPDRCAETRVVSPAYLQAIGTRILRGRGIASADDANASPIVVVDQSFARTYLGTGDVIGRRIKIHGKARTIAGVAVPARLMNIDELPNPAVYIPEAQDDRIGRERTFVVRAAIDPRAVAADAVAVIRQLSHDTALSDIRTMPDVVDHALTPQRFRAWLVGGFAGAALLLATVGIAGVLSFATSLRLREIGVRLALGSTSGGIIRLISGRALRLVGAGALIGIAAALLAGRFLAALLFGVQSADAMTLVSVTVVLALCGLTAAAIPAMRASRVEPITVLRSE